MEEEEDLSRCILSIHRTRQLFKFLGFGFLFLWILFGHYGGRQGGRVGQVSTSSASFTGRRRLLADQCSNASYDDCEVKDGNVPFFSLSPSPPFLLPCSVVIFISLWRSFSVSLFKMLSLVEEMMDSLVTLSLFTASYQSSSFRYH